MDGNSNCIEDELFTYISSGKINEAKALLKRTFEERRNSEKNIKGNDANSICATHNDNTHTSSVQVKSSFSNVELLNSSIRTRDLELVQWILKVGGRKSLLLETYESHSQEVDEESPWATYQTTGMGCYFPEGGTNQIEFVGYGPLHQACQLANHDLHSILLDETGEDENDRSALDATFNIIQYFVFIGGKELLLQKTKDFTKQNALHILCNHVRRKHLPSTLSSDQFHKQLASMQNMYKIMQLLIQHGGKEMICQSDVTGWTPFHYLCASFNSFISSDYNHDQIERQESSKSTLDPLASTETSESLVSSSPSTVYLTMIRYFVNSIQQQIFDLNPLFVLLRSTNYQSRLIVDTVESIISTTGGEELIRQIDPHYRGNILHVILQRNGTYTLDVIRAILHKGGAKLIWQCDGSGSNVLHSACEYNGSYEIIDTIFNMLHNKEDKKDLIYQKDNNGSNALHKICCYSDVSVEVVKYLVHIGGYELCLQRDSNGCIPLHYLARSYFFPNSFAIIQYLFGYDFMDKDRRVLASHIYHLNENSELPIHWFVMSFVRQTGNDDSIYNSLKVFEILLEQGIASGAFNEYEIGGLFSTITIGTKEHSVMDALLSKPSMTWDEIVRSIQNVMLTTTNGSNSNALPLIHGAIMRQGCENGDKTLKNLIQSFPHSVYVSDYKGDLPIITAKEFQLKWKNGMKEIVETLANVMPGERNAIHICTLYGLSLDCGVKQMIDMNSNCLSIVDKSTGLHPFMLAAAGSSSDLDAIYFIIKSRFDIVNFAIMKASRTNKIFLHQGL